MYSTTQQMRTQQMRFESSPQRGGVESVFEDANSAFQQWWEGEEDDFVGSRRMEANDNYGVPYEQHVSLREMAAVDDYEYTYEMPRNTREFAARQRRRNQDFAEKKAKRASRIKSISDQWAANRMQNSSLHDPKRDLCNYIFCCLG